MTLSDSAVALRRLLPDRHDHLHAYDGRQLSWTRRRTRSTATAPTPRHRLHAADHGHRGRHLPVGRHLQRRRATTTPSATTAARNEQVTVVSPASPTIVTTASPAVTLGATTPTLSDSAVVSGGYYETGSLVFTLSGPGSFSYTRRHGQRQRHLHASVHAAHDGHGGGHLHLVGHYAGDANNKTASRPERHGEQTVVSPASPTIVTTASPAVTLGTTARDAERLGGALRRLLPDRQRSFTLSGPAASPTARPTRSTATAPTPPATRCPRRARWRAPTPGRPLTTATAEQQRRRRDRQRRTEQTVVSPASRRS